MRKLILHIFIALLMIGVLPYITQWNTAQARAPLFASTPASFADLAEVLLPAVVNISSTQKTEKNKGRGALPPGIDDALPQFSPGSPFEDLFEQFFEGQRGGQRMQAPPQASLGSGFIVDAENGYIITNNHVIRDADEVRVTFHDDETLEAEVVGRDEKTDIAVLKVETDKKLMAVRFGDSDKMRVGDWIMAIGNPFGLGGTVTAGIVSARQRDIQSGPYDDYIQTDASINRGNSGGPMFNLSGEVIGINTAIYSPTGGSVGIGFAIPAALANPVINQIIKFGRTRRGWLGVRIQTVTDEIAESLGLESTKGALIASVTKGGPAEKAGLQAGDVILKFNNKDIGAMRTLPRAVAETKIETKADVVIWREGKMKTTAVRIGELEKAEDSGIITGEASTPTAPEQKGENIEEMGLTLKSLSETLRKEYGIDNGVSGVLVSDVDIKSEAARKGLSDGDVIMEINQRAVKTPSTVDSVVQNALKRGRKSVLLLVYRDGDVRFMALKLTDDKTSDGE